MEIKLINKDADIYEVVGAKGMYVVKVGDQWQSLYGEVIDIEFIIKH
jgi:hypothetical protein